MKKVLCFILALVLTVTPVFAAEIDLSSLSDEELVDLQERVMEELDNRSVLTAVPLTQGNYVVGTDIAAGQYIFTPVPSDDSYGGVVSIFKDPQSTTMQDLVSGKYFSPSKPDEEFHASLLDGQFILVKDQGIMIAKAPALPFAPDETE